ncbi:MAG TPA: DNA alkylation repair protein [Lacunisphaera sp.]
MSADAQPALKDWFNVARYRQIADLLADVQPGFDRQRFLAVATAGLDELTLIQRVRRATEACHATLPAYFPQAVVTLKRIAPRVQHGFVGIFLPDYVGQHGHGHFVESMEALKFFTPFSSAEFAIREFLRRDLTRTLAVMERWSRDENEHVRRLASEGSRPRLPWSFRIEPIVATPALTAPILENLRADPSLYVRKSVANHLNDISKDHPGWMIARLKSWDLAHPHTQWIAKRAARTLIKAGHPPALHLFNFGGKPALKVADFKVAPARLKLGQTLDFSFSLTSTSRQAQPLAVDYVIHYVKASGGTSAKVFKLRELTLAAGETQVIRKRQTVRNFTTRKHHTGRHRVEIQINGRILAQGHFQLIL